MNTYQKVLVCFFRALGILVILYSMVVAFGAFLIVRAMPYQAGAVIAGPFFAGLVLYYAAKPLARIITNGIEK